MKKNTPKKGLVLVFVVLCFQVLIFCIAMVLNVGLVVHDKINLQNSVDLGAIYAAQKQAEVLNAISHINYQMRQSYKLLVWRYLVLSQIGAQNKQDNYSILKRPPNPNLASCTNLNKKSPGPCPITRVKNMNDAPYATCFGHPYFYHGVTTKTHNCQGLGGFKALSTRSSSQLNILKSIPLGGNLLTSTAKSDLEIATSCEGDAEIHWMLSSSFYFVFQQDIKRRVALIENLFELLKNGYDISGKSIKEGVFKTVRNNLTFVNYINFKEENIEFLSSIQDKSFEDIFAWHDISPILFFVNFESESDRNCLGFIHPMYLPPENTEAFRKMYPHLIGSQGQFLNNPQVPLGFYKNSSHTIHSKVSVSMNYNRQIFFPFFRPQNIQGEAYARPFGGKFGNPDKDILAPVTHFDTTQPITEEYKEHFPNYSRFPGDTLGLLASDVQLYWNKVLMKNTDEPQLKNQLTNRGLSAEYYYWHAIDHITSPDPIVVSYENPRKRKQKIFNTEITQLESAAVAPDAFDIFYYSISPNYMTTLYPQIRDNNFLKNSLQLLPGDLGHYNSKEIGADTDTSSGPWIETDLCGLEQKGPFRLNYIERQVACANEYLNELQSKYFLNNIDQVLTSWFPPQQKYTHEEVSYSRKTGTCEITDNKVKMSYIKNGFENPSKIPLTPSHCVVGARTGFSALLISPSSIN